jgi:hypothetical protein
MTPRSFAGFAALGGTVVLAGWGVAGLGSFEASHADKAAASIDDRGPKPQAPAVATRAISVGEAAPGNADLPAPVAPVVVAGAGPISVPSVPAGAAAAAVPAVAPAVTDVGRTPPPETGMQLASVPTSDPMNGDRKPPAGAIDSPHECAADTCIDEYLWSLYERTPKIDTVKVPQKIKATVKTKGKTRTVTRTVDTYVADDFTWKDPAAAQRAGMSLMDYVIGGMDRGFKLKLYQACRAMDEAGLVPGITSGFRDDYRQSVASGNKAASDSSYHGGSRRGGYGPGLAADLVSVRGDTRTQRSAASEEVWKWVDAHGKDFGIGRPYLDRDPPHVGPIAGAEYIVKRGLMNAQHHASVRKTADKTRPETTKPQLAARADAAATRGGGPAKLSKKLSKLSSLQKRSAVQR